MIRDGRTLDHKTPEEIRRMAVERVREGEEPSAVISSYGLCRTTIYKWLNVKNFRDLLPCQAQALRLRVHGLESGRDLLS
jgi:hypothetical protein